jgi:phage shock protein PspC (stress-responsive transcriptional regulator)
MFLRAGFLFGIVVYILVWLLIPEQTEAGRILFAFMGCMIWVV